MVCAAALVIAVRRVQFLLIGAAALTTAVMVSIVGPIGFVGLVIPHATRFIVGVRHRRLVPASALAGAVFLIVSDIISRVIIPARCCPSASSQPWSERQLSPSSRRAARPPDEPPGAGRRPAEP